MTGPVSAYVSAGEHEIHVTHWGDPANPALVMWHGLARTGRDFDEPASALSDQYFVLCPDTLGRGLSSWARDVNTDYSYKAYGDQAEAVLDHFGIGKVRWVGTSMGGLIGVTLAGDRMRDRITHLVVNDVGPSIPVEATTRIAAYVGGPPEFDKVSELEAWLRKNYTPFGQNPESFWRRMADSSGRRMDNGKITVHYDPRITSQFTVHKGDLDVWPYWDQIAAKTLLTRGANSDVLPKALADEMCSRGPKAEFVEFEGFGHAPTLGSEAEIAVIRRFLSV
ncbi:MAG: alpha/beta hydrolase [Hyphomicrobiaceae bacterium]|nr:alpha/beta hydrolase [Hyphomicrobiaceae bacterium]